MSNVILKKINTYCFPQGITLDIVRRTHFKAENAFPSFDVQDLKRKPLGWVGVRGPGSVQTAEAKKKPPRFRVGVRKPGLFVALFPNHTDQK